MWKFKINYILFYSLICFTWSNILRTIHISNISHSSVLTPDIYTITEPPPPPPPGSVTAINNLVHNHNTSIEVCHNANWTLNATIVLQCSTKWANAAIKVAYIWYRIDQYQLISWFCFPTMKYIYNINIIKHNTTIEAASLAASQLINLEASWPVVWSPKGVTKNEIIAEEIKKCL